jgi:hypothetical protein
VVRCCLPLGCCCCYHWTAVHPEWRRPAGQCSDGISLRLSAHLVAWRPQVPRDRCCTRTYSGPVDLADQHSEVCVEADATDVAHRVYNCFFVYLSILSYPRSRTQRRSFSFFFFLLFLFCSRVLRVWFLCCFRECFSTVCLQSILGAICNIRSRAPFPGLRVKVSDWTSISPRAKPPRFW